VSTRDKLRSFAEKYGLREDWHEPDEQEVSAVVRGRKLDNAYGDEGSALYWPDEAPYEKVVVLKVGREEVLQVNLATILALACQSEMDL
jgi:hypothetical protein